MNGLGVGKLLSPNSGIDTCLIDLPVFTITAQALPMNSPAASLL